MIYINCYRILQDCVNAGLIHRISSEDMVKDEHGNTIPVSPETVGKLAIWRQGSATSPAGWYAESIDKMAQELMNDVDGQNYLMSQLEENGITPDLLDEEQFKERT